MSVHIAVDVGGTQLRAASYLPESLNPLKLDKIPTQGPDGSPLDRLKKLIASVIPENDTVSAIGVAAPGAVNPYQGIIHTAPNIPGWTNLALGPDLQSFFDTPVYIGNDANMAALAEWQYGAGRGHHHLIYITVSTGIGTGVIIDDRLLLGVSGLATEMGHVTVMMDGPMCGCGLRGHIEAFASGTAIAKYVEEELAKGIQSILPERTRLSAKDVAAAAYQGDQLSITAFQRAGRVLGIGLANYLHIFNPSIIIIGGGVSRSGEILFGPMRASLEENVLSSQYLDGLTLTSSTLGDEVGLLGALALARSLPGN
jgi:glucokinase